VGVENCYLPSTKPVAVDTAGVTSSIYPTQNRPIDGPLLSILGCRELPFPGIEKKDRVSQISLTSLRLLRVRL